MKRIVFLFLLLFVSSLCFAGGASVGDDLGNHKATKDLDFNNFKGYNIIVVVISSIQARHGDLNFKDITDNVKLLMQSGAFTFNIQGRFGAGLNTNSIDTYSGSQIDFNSRYLENIWYLRSPETDYPIIIEGRDNTTIYPSIIFLCNATNGPKPAHMYSSFAGGLVHGRANYYTVQSTDTGSS